MAGSSKTIETIMFTEAASYKFEWRMLQKNLDLHGGILRVKVLSETLSKICLITAMKG